MLHWLLNFQGQELCDNDNESVYDPSAEESDDYLESSDEEDKKLKYKQAVGFKKNYCSDLMRSKISLDTHC